MSDSTCNIEAQVADILASNPACVDWTAQFHQAEQNTFASMRAHLRFKKPSGKLDPARKRIAVGTFASLFLSIFSLLTGIVPMLGPGEDSVLTIFALSWSLMVPFLAFVIIAVTLDVRKAAKNAIAPEAKVHVPEAICYSARLQESARHAGGEVVILRSAPGQEANQIGTLALPVCDIAQVTQVMDKVNHLLASQNIKDNIEREQLLVEAGLDDASLGSTKTKLLEQARVVHEYNYVNRGAFEAINEQLVRETSLGDETSQTLTASA